METIDLSPENLLPHAHPMILIDAVRGYGDNFAEVLVTPAPGKPFADADGNIPAWVGMEYMAQGIATFAGIRARSANQPVKVGFLLGTRAYEVATEHFRNGQTYAIRVQKIYEDGSLSAFECTIQLNDQHNHLAADQENIPDNNILARAVINTFQPDNLDEFMEGGKR